MTEQKYRLTVNTLKHHETLTFDGTYEDIISELESTQRGLHEPLMWAEEVAHLVTCPECEGLTWTNVWWYWKERVGEQEAYRTERPEPNYDSIREYAYHVLKNDMLGCKKWEHLITRAHDFDLPVSLSEVKAGWVVEDTAKVLDVFSLGLRTFAVYEML